MENSMTALMTTRGGLVVGILTSALFMVTANAQGMVLIEKRRTEDRPHGLRRAGMRLRVRQRRRGPPVSSVR
jgi:hypothetical protein